MLLDGQLYCGVPTVPTYATPLSARRRCAVTAGEDAAGEEEHGRRALRQMPCACGMTFGPGTNQCGWGRFRRGSDGQCTVCGKAEGDHYGSSKFCYDLDPFFRLTFRRGSDGQCFGCVKAEGDHYDGSSKFCYRGAFEGALAESLRLCGCCKCAKQRNPGWNFDGLACVACKNRQLEEQTRQAVEAKAKAEAQEKRKQEEAAKQKAAAEAKAKAEVEAKRKQEEAAKQQAAAEAKAKAEAEAKRKQ
jgi:hypothetical protein